jgi:hypothetical protein
MSPAAILAPALLPDGTPGYASQAEADAIAAALAKIKREKILAALSAFVAQRPGLEPGNYGDWPSYRAELRGIIQDRHDAYRLLRQVELMETSIPLEAIEAALAGRGRLSMSTKANGAISIDYCTGQYFPTEYRAAVARLCSGLIWDAARENMVPSGEGPTNAGDYLRNKFRREFGRRIANRYFD